MKSIKVIAAAVLFVILSAGFVPEAGAQEFTISAGLSWDLCIKAGGSYMFMPGIGVKADVGISLFSAEGDFALCYDLLLAVRKGGGESPFSYGAYLGIPSGYLVFTEPAAVMFAPGISVFGGYSLNSDTELLIHFGAGYPAFLESGDWTWGNTRFPMGLWPDLGIELALDI